MKPIITLEFKYNSPEDTYEIVYQRNDFGVKGAETETKQITKEEYEFLQLHLNNII